jgi:dipeptidyl aminopeptidase/acylaminoacyl peptidase
MRGASEVAEADGARRALTPEDIFNIKLINDARISPDGSRIVYVETVLDKEKDEYKSSLYMVPSGGEKSRRFTASEAKDSMPRWSPDGSKIAFLSNRSGSNQIWAIDVAGGEANQITDLPEPVSAFSWSPDGTSIAFVSKADAEKMKEAKEEEKKDEKKSDVVRISDLRFRADGTPGFLDNKPVHIWTTSIDGGEPKQITAGEFDDSSPSWSPDGSTIVFASNRTDQKHLKKASEIWRVPATGGDPSPVLTGNSSLFSGPVWSPDGRYIAVEGHNNSVAGHAIGADLWIVEPNGSGLKKITEGLDRHIGDTSAVDTASGADVPVVWSGDSTSILFQVSDHGNVHVMRASIDGGDVEQVIGGKRRIMSFSVSDDGKTIGFSAGTSTNPCDVYSCAADGSGEKRLTSVNEEFFNTVDVSVPEEIEVESLSDDHAKIHGWIMKPIGFQEGQKYPLVLEIHGGPHAMYGNAYFHEFQLLAAQGYAVVFGNPRGSQGYGSEFSSCTKGEWGFSDMPDVMALVDHAIGLGYVDPERLGVTGGSYGGFMTSWIVGHTDRFKAAVTQRPVTNLYSFYGTSDIGSTFGDYETGGTPWADTEQFLRMSPITYVDKVVTPLLFIHSEQDYRCPIEQSEQMFVALKMLGRETELVRFPNESHGLSRMGKPAHRIERLNAILGWFENYL